MNDSPLDITSIDYQITDGDYLFTSTGNTSNIFSNVQVLNGGKELLFAGGTIAPGEYFNVVRSYNPQTGAPFKPVLTLQYSSRASVPESSSVLGILLVGGFGASLLQKRKLRASV